MEKNRIAFYIDRLENVLRCLRHQNSGADIHAVGNMRNTASGLKHLLEDDPTCLDAIWIEKLTKNVEDAMIQFFKIKYGVEPLRKIKHKHPDNQKS